MKLIHLSDLHIGKSVNGFSMITDQRYILSQILKIIDRENIDCVMISGDIYDKTVPSAEAVTLADSFFTSLCERDIYTFVISGNHDSAERLSFGSRIFESKKLFISPVFDGKMKQVELNDEYGKIVFCLLPFIKPAVVRKYFENDDIRDSNAAVKAVIDSTNIDKTARNIILSHQFVTGAKTCESEEISVGGADNVDVSVYGDFDYVALGHLHMPQNIGKNARYCGTPLKYSFSEAFGVKSATIINMAEKGSISVNEVELSPLRDMREIRGTFREIADNDDTECGDYMHITLTDEDETENALQKLRRKYEFIMRLDYDNEKIRHYEHITADANIENKSEAELFGEFFYSRNGKEMSELQKKIVKELFDKQSNSDDTEADKLCE